MRRKQKTVYSGWLWDDMVEPESTKGAHSVGILEPVSEDGVENLLERILDRDNLNQAYQRVKSNKGAAGVDGMTTTQLLPYLQEHREELLKSILEGYYKPKPVRRVEIPKPDGGKRMLGVPTVIDRMLQQAIVQVLQPVYEPLFSESSYGFRPSRSAHQAIKQARDYYDAGYNYAVDIDLARYFDTVNHDILIGMLRKTIKDDRVISLIRKFLKSGVMIDGLASPTTEGTPQGGNLSPLLSNIYLSSFDLLLESRGHKFVRYADDCNIYVKSQRAAERVMANCTRFLEGKLKLKVNRIKSQTGSPGKLKFLGFSLYKGKGGAGIRPHSKSIERFKTKVKELTSRKQARSIEEILVRLKRYTTGWLGYYSIADMRGKIRSLDEWLRHRVRQIYWKQWKRISAKLSNLIKLGVDKYKAWEWANSRKGYWRVSASPVLQRTLTNEYLADAGYDNIAERHEILHSNY
jgi:RNA-directed DNA polymerase